MRGKKIEKLKIGVGALPCHVLRSAAQLASLSFPPPSLFHLSNEIALEVKENGGRRGGILLLSSRAVTFCPSKVLYFLFQGEGGGIEARPTDHEL